MSDSDSDDNFAALISNSETNFWKTYDVQTTVKDDPAENVMHTNFPTDMNTDDCDEPSTSKTNSKGKGAKSKSKQSKATKRLSNSPKPSTSKGTKSKATRSKRRESTSSSFDDSYNDANSQSGKKRRKATTAQTETSNDLSTSSNNLFKTILQTLSASTAPAAQPSSESREESTIPTSIQAEVDDPCTSSNSLFNSILQTLSASTAPAPQPSSETREENIIPTNIRNIRRTTRRNPRRNATRNVPTHTPPNTDYNEIVNAVIEDGSKTPPPKSVSVESINPQIELKIIWKSYYKKKFKIKRFTPLKKIVSYFAEKENIEAKHILFSINDKFVNLNAHSCFTLQYYPHDEIEGSIVPFDVNAKRLTKNEGGVKLKVQLNRTVEHVVLNADIMLAHLYAQVVIKFDLPLERFKLQFDGRTIDFLHTIRDLGMEEDDCIDIMLI